MSGPISQMKGLHRIIQTYYTYFIPYKNPLQFIITIQEPLIENPHLFTIPYVEAPN